MGALSCADGIEEFVIFYQAQFYSQCIMITWDEINNSSAQLLFNPLTL